MNLAQNTLHAKFDFWKKHESDPKDTHMSDFKQVAIYWCLLGLLFIITVNVYSPVGTKTHFYKPEMLRVLYEDDDALTKILGDEITTTTGDTQ
jgi:hypothetical protein